MKELFYKTPIEYEDDLVARIAAAASEIQEDPDMFARVRASMVERCRTCNAADGQHFEELL